MYSIIYFVTGDDGLPMAKTYNFNSLERAKMYIEYLMARKVTKVDLYTEDGKVYTFTP